MIRLNIVAEGQTEQRFIDQLIKPHLLPMDVSVSCRCVRTSSKGKIYSGGISNFGKLKRDIVRWVRQDRQKDARFTTMIDLYGLPGDFPGYKKAVAHSDPYKVVAELEENFGAEISDHRFIPYLQLHEFEALLLSDPAAFKAYFKNPNVCALQALTKDLSSPELINRGEKTAPSKRIIEILPEYSGLKAVAGPVIAARTGMEKMREKCRHFDEWISRLETLGAP